MNIMVVWVKNHKKQQVILYHAFLLDKKNVIDIKDIKKRKVHK